MGTSYGYPLYWFSNKAESVYCGMCGTHLFAESESELMPVLSYEEAHDDIHYRHNMQKPKLAALIKEQQIVCADNSDGDSPLNQDAIESLFKGKQ